MLNVNIAILSKGGKILSIAASSPDPAWNRNYGTVSTHAELQLYNNYKMNWSRCTLYVLRVNLIKKQLNILPNSSPCRHCMRDIILRKLPRKLVYMKNNKIIKQSVTNYINYPPHYSVRCEKWMKYTN